MPIFSCKIKLDPVGSTVRCEEMKLCVHCTQYTGSVWDSDGWYLAVLSHYEADIDFIGSIKGVDAFIH